MIHALRALAAAMLIISALPASAQDVSGPHPGLLYSVQGVAENDVLNVRQYAGIDETIVGTLAPAASDVVTTGNWTNLDGSEWWQILLDDSYGRGWVNARYLAPSAPGGTAETDYPLLCQGTEPFWSLDITGAAAIGDDYILESRTFTASPWQMAYGMRGWFAIYLEENSTKPPAKGSIAVTMAQCTDGMSDTQYSFLSTLVLPDGEVYGGCCSRAGR